MGIDGGGGSEQLTEQETALYDRQIRVWGVDAQRRLSKSRILVSGVSGATAEFCKNIVLAGVGSLTLVDDRVVTEDALQANFLIIPNPDEYAGRSLAELSCDSLRDFNPMVHVSFVKGDLSQFDSEFFDNFDAVIVGYCSLTTKKVANNKCRNRPKPVPFYTVDCRDSCGEIFVDLQDHTYSKKTPEGSVECRVKYISFEESIAVPWKDLPRKIAKLYYGMRVIERLEVSQENENKDATTPDLSIILKLRKELCQAQQTSETLIPTNLLRRLLAAGRKEHPPVCAILGGILGQEVIKALSGKGDPIKNFFYFDTVDGKGVIEDICAPAHKLIPY